MNDRGDEWRRRYKLAMRSERWWKLRERLLADAGGRCRRCGLIAIGLQVHHRTYERLGHEEDDDLEVVCTVCHPEADVEREEESQARSARSLRMAQIDGWARKVYGDDWAHFEDPQRIAEEFDEWAEGR